MRIITSRPGGEDLSSSFRVYTNGRQRTQAYQTEPASFAGRRMLILDRQAWLYMPGLSRPLHVFLQHVVKGEVASGDIARLALSAQYVPAGLAEEELEGTPWYRLGLQARAPGATYPRILYWVAKRNYRPVKLEFFASSGRRMKTGWYGEYRRALGGLYPMRLVLEDAADSGYRSVLEFGNFRRVALPDSLYAPEALAGMVTPPDESGAPAPPRAGARKVEQLPERAVPAETPAD